MKWNAFPDRIKTLEPFSCRFDTFRLAVEEIEFWFKAGENN